MKLCWSSWWFRPHETFWSLAPTDVTPLTQDSFPKMLLLPTKVLPHLSSLPHQTKPPQMPPPPTDVTPPGAQRHQQRKFQPQISLAHFLVADLVGLHVSNLHELMELDGVSSGHVGHAEQRPLSIVSQKIVPGLIPARHFIFWVTCFHG